MKNIIHHNKLWFIAEKQEWLNINKSVSVTHTLEGWIVIIPIDTEEVLYKVQNLFTLKENNTQKTENRRKYS